MPRPRDKTEAKRLTDQQVVDEIRDKTSLRNVVREQIESWANRRENDSRQRQPMKPVEAKRDALDMAEILIDLVRNADARKKILGGADASTRGLRMHELPVGDKGQRWEVQTKGYPKDEQQAVGWAGTQKGAKSMAEGFAKAPGFEYARVVDREGKEPNLTLREGTWFT